MNYLLHIIMGFVLSFVGSLPLGIINMTVAKKTIEKGFKAGLMIAIGASLVELFQAFISIKFSYIFVENATLDFVFNMLAFAIFLGLGIYYFFIIKSKPPTINQKSDTQKMPDFFVGMLVSSMNVLVIPYWIFYGTYLTANGWLKQGDEYLYLFIIGVSLGTFVLLLLYARLGLFIVNKATQFTAFVNKFIGLVFLGFAGYQALKLITY